MAEMKQYIEWHMQGASSIPGRKVFLFFQKDLQAAFDYIDWKQSFYDDVLFGKTPYVSNLIVLDEEAWP